MFPSASTILTFTPSPAPAFCRRRLHAKVSPPQNPIRWTSAVSSSGVFMVKGPGLRAGQCVDVRSIDIAPTVLHLLGLPVGRDLPGVVKENAFEPEALAGSPVQFIESWETLGGDYVPPERSTVSDAVDKEVVDRLRALGYF